MESLLAFQRLLQSHLAPNRLEDDRQQATAQFLTEATAAIEDQHQCVPPLPDSASFSSNMEPPEDDIVSPKTIAAMKAQYYEYRGRRVIGFQMGERQMICLPQVYELFLKQLVGGLHTIYTKLKRLNIQPIICTVDQVRALRSLGAIQPGVNRCKLIDRIDFDKLFDDCTNSGSRPGRPPKRGTSLEEAASPLVKRECTEAATPFPFLLLLQNRDSGTSASESGLLPPNFPTNGPSNSDPGAGAQKFPHLLPVTAQQLIMQQLMAAAAFVVQPQASSVERDQSRTEIEAKMPGILQADDQRNAAYANANCAPTENKTNWGNENDAETSVEVEPEQENDKSDKNDSISPNNNSFSFVDNNSDPSLPTSSLNSSNSDSNSSIGREQSLSVDFSSSSGSSSDMHVMCKRLNKTVMSMENKFERQYDSFFAVTAQLNQTLEEINRKHSQMVSLLEKQQQQSYKLTSSDVSAVDAIVTNRYFRRYITKRDEVNSLRRRTRHRRISKTLSFG